VGAGRVVEWQTNGTLTQARDLLGSAGEHERVLGLSHVAAGAASNDVRPECSNRSSKIPANGFLISGKRRVNLNFRDVVINLGVRGILSA
jgi:hypothetical protein